MHPVDFPGSITIKRPPTMTQEQCADIPAAIGKDDDGNIFFLTAWKPNYEDLTALNRGEPVYVKTLAKFLPPMALFTMEDDQTPQK